MHQEKKEKAQGKLNTGLHIQLFSCGLESLIMWHLLGQPQPVYVRYGHKYEGRELETIRSLEKAYLTLRVTILDGLQLGVQEQEDGHIPHRNLLLILTPIASLSPSVVYLGPLRGETSRDKSKRFLRQTSKLLRFCEELVEVLSSSKRWTKTQLVARFIRRHPNRIDRLRFTRSCYGESNLLCDRCLACLRHWLAMGNNGFHEAYEVEP